MKGTLKKEPWYNSMWFVRPVFSMILAGALVLAAKALWLFALFVFSLVTFPTVCFFAALSVMLYMILGD